MDKILSAYNCQDNDGKNRESRVCSHLTEVIKTMLYFLFMRGGEYQNIFVSFFFLFFPYL